MYCTFLLGGIGVGKKLQLPGTQIWWHYDNPQCACSIPSLDESLVYSESVQEYSVNYKSAVLDI